MPIPLDYVTPRPDPPPRRRYHPKPRPTGSHFRIYWPLCIILTVYPAAALLAQYLAWLAAWFTLGHWPESMADAPWKIGGTMFTIASAFQVVTMIACCPLFPAVILVPIAAMANANSNQKERLINLFFVACVIWAGVGLLAFWDPLGVLRWAMYWD